VVRKGISQILEATEDIIVTDEASSGDELLAKIQNYKYDVVLLDISMPGKDGLITLREIKQMKSDLPVIIFTVYPEEQYAIRVLKSGAAGYINKQSEPQEIITNDNLNASVDAQVYFRVKSEEESVKGAIYNVNNYRYQIVNLARTTLRNIIGTLTLKSANSERGKINAELYNTLHIETKSWGIEIVRTELKEIDPPRDVQETMNKVVKAENEKIAAIDSATAAETVADGVKRAKIKEAEGYKQSKILHAEGEAEAIRLVNEAADKYFVGNAQLLRKLEAVEASLSNNAKIVVPTGTELVNIIGEMAGGILPLERKRKDN